MCVLLPTAYLPPLPFPPLPSLPPLAAACALSTTEDFPCSLPPPGLVLICSSTATVGLTYREARTVECSNCSPRTRRGAEVGVDDYHMLPSLPISRTSITIITFPYFLFLVPIHPSTSPHLPLPLLGWVVVSSIGSWEFSFPQEYSMPPREVCRGSSHPRRGEGARKERVCGVGGWFERTVCRMFQ